MASLDEFERAQAQAMDLLIQQCVAPPTASPSVNAQANATVLDLLAQTCADAADAVQELTVEEAAAALASAVDATQQSLRHVGRNVGEILQDPQQMQLLCQHVQQADAHVLRALHSIEEAHAEDAQIVLKNADNTLSVQTDEDSVRSMMQLAENMCATMDHALGTITKDELDLAAQLSLNIAQKLLNAGQALFVSLGDEERRKVRGERGDRITIEELEEEEESKEQKSAAVLHTYVKQLYTKTQRDVVEHPFLAGALTAAGLPFIGLAIPVASLVALALMMEKYYPEHATLTLELCSNFIQMSKLWFLLLKISARQVGVVAKECFNSWYEYASANGFMATGVELASTGCNLGLLGISYLYKSVMHYSQQVLQ